MISYDGVYRYRLWRRWARGPALVFMMLNPSTADAEQDDPTIRRCAGFARREGAAALEVVNLYALRSSDPRELVGHPDPEGPDNLETVTAVMSEALDVVVAWGGSAPRVTPSGIRSLLDHRDLWCLGTTAGGDPRHPLYVRADTPLRRWPT